MASQMDVICYRLLLINSNIKNKITTIYTENGTTIEYPVYTGLKLFVVLSAMGSNGINGNPAVAFVLNINYGATECSISYIHQPNACTVQSELSKGKVKISVSYNSKTELYIKALIIPMG